MPAAGRRTMPRPAVGVRPSASCYAPAVPRGLRLCRGGAEGSPSTFAPCAAGWADRTFALPLCRGVCGCAARVAGSTPSTFATCAAGWADRTFALPPCRAICGCAARVAESPPLLFPTCAAGWADRTFALPPCRAVCGCAAGVAEGPPLLFPTCAAGVLVFHSLRQIFSRCPH